MAHLELTACLSLSLISLTLCVHLQLHPSLAAVSSDITEMEDIIEINNSPSHLLSIHGKHFSHQRFICQRLWQCDHLVHSHSEVYVFLCISTLQSLLACCVRRVGLHAAWPTFGLVQTRIPLTSENRESQGARESQSLVVDSREINTALVHFLYTVNSVCGEKTEFILR